MMKHITPNMAVDNVQKTVEYYVDNFGFKLVMAVSEDKSSIGDDFVKDKKYIWANIVQGEVGIMFQSIESIKEDVGDFFHEVGASVTFYIEIENVDSLYERVKESVEIEKGIETSWYGMREFYVKDMNGYIIVFAENMT